MAGASPTWAAGAKQGASRPTPPHLLCLLCGSALPGHRSRIAALICIARLRGRVWLGALVFQCSLFPFCTLSLRRNVGPRLRSALHLCVGHGPRLTSASASAHYEAGRASSCYSSVGEESGNGPDERAPRVWPAGSDPSLRWSFILAESVLGTSALQFAEGGVGLRPWAAPNHPVIARFSGQQLHLE
ncbi:hypothetical protein NDU88_004735 [Pleurodeles waltl]|uniref:Uncharacterized protein n=1 Tax=Pleurodeles waltl TaxID=8319 RepID=A0AAV7WYR6_PLEWA|nr:hypothetical protein NDU88_004735 [Pleurodeles waltl]